jgi:hypothetical protein
MDRSVELGRFGYINIKTKSYGQLQIKFEPTNQWRL